MYHCDPTTVSRQKSAVSQISFERVPINQVNRHHPCTEQAKAPLEIDEVQNVTNLQQCAANLSQDAGKSAPSLSPQPALCHLHMQATIILLSDIQSHSQADACSTELGKGLLANRR